MRTSLVAPLVVVALGLGCLAQAAEIESGLKIGDRVGAFNVKDITGPSAGKSLCYHRNSLCSQGKGFSVQQAPRHRAQVRPGGIVRRKYDNRGEFCRRP